LQEPDFVSRLLRCFAGREHFLLTRLSKCLNPNLHGQSVSDQIEGIYWRFSPWKLANRDFLPALLDANAGYERELLRQLQKLYMDIVSSSESEDEDSGSMLAPPAPAEGSAADLGVIEREIRTLYAERAPHVLKHDGVVDEMLRGHRGHERELLQMLRARYAGEKRP
jgi:hypothetical protein